MRKKLHPKQIIQFCDRLEYIIKFMSDIIQVVMGMKMFPPSEKEANRNCSNNPMNDELEECFQMDYMFLEQIGFRIVDGDIQATDKTESNTESVRRAVIGYTAIFPNGKRGNFFWGDKPPKNSTIDQFHIHNRYALHLEKYICRAIRDAFIPIEPLLGWDNKPEFPPLWSQDPYSAMSESQKVYKNSLAGIDKVRREAIRQSGLTLKPSTLSKYDNIDSKKHLLMNNNQEPYLDPTDISILHLFKDLNGSGTRLLSGQIAEKLGRPSKNIAKNLSHLVKLRLLDNIKRKGYCMTDAGLKYL